MRFNIVDIVGGVLAVIVIIGILRTIDTRTGTSFVSNKTKLPSSNSGKVHLRPSRSMQRRANKAQRQANKRVRIGGGGN